MSWQGTRTLEETFYFHFTTRRFSTGAPHTLAGTPSLSAYEDNSDTQITAGLTLAADADSKTGFNRVTVVATAANGYEADKDYSIVIEAGTVDSVSVVGEVIGEFRIGVVPANVTEISDDATAAANLESACDNYSATRGLSGTALPAFAADAGGGLPISIAGSLDLDAMDANVTTLLGRISATLFNGITSLRQWLGCLAHNNADDATALSEINASGSGGGSYDQSAHSQEATGDNAASILVSELSANVTKVSGSSTAADNLELQYDTTGLSGDTFPASQAQVDGIGSGSAGAVNIKATEDNSSAAIIDSVTKVGTITGDFNNVHADTGGSTIISILDDSDDIDFVLGYDVGGARAGTSVSIVANVNGNADSMTIEAYDHVGAGWDIIGILNGSGGGSYVTKDYPLYAEHTGTSGELGKVYIRFDNNGTTPSLLQIDRCSVAAVNTSTSVGYADGAYWVDSAGTSGTEIGTNGTADNPCTWANAVSMNGTQALNRFHIAANTSITLSATAANYSFLGQAYSVALGSQNIDGAFFFGANVTGIGTWTSTHPIFEDCPIGTVTLPPSIMRRCFLSGTITASAAGDFYLNHCVSRIAGASSPVFDFGGAVGNSSLNMRLYSGGIQLESMGDTGTDTASIEGFGQVIEGTCTGGNVSVRGNMTLSGVTNITFSDDARIDVGQINTQCDTALSDYDPPTKAEMDTGHGLLATEAKQDTMQTAVTAIKAITDAMGATAAANFALALGASGVVTGAAVTGTLSTTVMTTDLAQTTDDHYIGRIIVWTSGDLAGQATDITDYSGTNGTCTFTAVTEAPSNTDAFIIV